MSTETTQSEQSDQRGVLEIDHRLLAGLAPEISTGKLDTMGHLRDTGVFARLKERLLLPESYTILAIVLQPNMRTWAILIESPDFPDARDFYWNDIEYPRIVPTYCQTLNKETGLYDPHLVEIKVHAQRTIPVTDGHRWLMRSVTEEVSKVTGIKFKERTNGDNQSSKLTTLP